MKLDLEKPVINKDNLQQEHLFGIEDTGMIFNILRNKMYSNKIMAICKEISCNARDAHREVKKMDVPIEITLPSSFEPNFKIKDFGPGISPDRMVNIFINYASSTKRNDNIQIGGFGLGSKTPFSYGDSFNIITTVDGIKYSYSAYIDETLIGKLALLNKEETAEPNGTEIIVPVKNQDVSEFRRCCIEVFEHWSPDECDNSVRPIIHGYKIEYPGKLDALLEDKNWKLFENHNSYDLNVEFIIDGIKYPLDLASFKTKKFWKEISSLRGKLVIYFPTGVISIAANRESVDLTPKVEETISTILQEFVSSINSKLEAKIANAKDIWEASDLYTKLCGIYYSSYRYSGNWPTLIWNNVKLSSDFPTHYESFKFSIRDITNNKTKILEKSIYRSRAYGFKPSKTNYKIFINDTGREIKDIKLTDFQKIFDKYPGLEEIIVISDDDYKLNFLPYIKVIEHSQLSEFIAKARNINRSPSQEPRVSYYKFDSLLQKFVRTSIEIIKEDNNIKAYIQFTRSPYGREDKIFTFKNKEIDFKKLSPLLANISLYAFEQQEGIDKIKKIDKKILSFIDLISGHAQMKIKPDLEQIAYSRAMEQFTSGRIFRRVSSDDIAPLISNKEGLFNKYFEASKNVYEMAEKFRRLNSSLDLFSKNFKDSIKTFNLNKLSRPNLKDMSDNIYIKYPLLKYIDSYYDDGSCTKPLADYINLIDETEKIKNDSKGNK